MKKLFILFSLFLLFLAATSNAQQVNVTFQVDMNVQIQKGTFDPAIDSVTVAGGFNEWLNEPPANTEKVMDDGDGDGVYTKTIAMEGNQTYQYKYAIGLEWGRDELQGQDNRTVDVVDTDLTLDPVFFNNETANGDPAQVTFNADMRVIAKTDFDPAVDKVFLAGSFTGWADGAAEMADPEGDSVYTVTIDTLVGGTSIEYKYIFTPDPAASLTWETVDNRKFFVLDGASSVSHFWDDIEPTAELADGNILFEVNMSVATELGVFNPDADSVQIRGSFNGWGDSEPDRSLLNQDPGDPDAWFLDVPFTQHPLSDTLKYKWFIKNPEGADFQFSNTGWEVPLGNTVTIDRNRTLVFEGDQVQEAPIVFWGNVHPDWVIPEGTTVEAEFSVDMTVATIADSQGTDPVFDPAADTVYWMPMQPFYHAVHDLEWGADHRILQLVDSDNDMIYTGVLSLTGPAFNGFLYQYAYKSANGGFVREGGGQGGARVRFIGQSGGPRTFDSPWTMPQDAWANGEKPEEEGPDGLTAVEALDELPDQFKLEQNYPNPFNPSTTIQFSIPSANLVTLKVFNILGQEVATVLNEEMNVGTYKVDFDASTLSSGVYVYSIQAGNFVSTKKMILLK